MTEAPSWAKGHDLAFLKSVAAIFKAAFKPHTYGAFGIPKERDVADALSARDLAWTKAGGEEIAAAAIFRRLARPSSHEDFSGRKATILAGDILIRSLAGSPEGCARLIEHLAPAGPAVWVEAHVEASIHRQLLDLGFELVMTKVSASSDLRGLFIRGETARRLPPPLASSEAPGVKVLLADFITEAEAAAILEEAREAAIWAQHYSSYNRRSSWTAFALCGYDPAEPGFIIKPDEMSKAWKAEHAAQMAGPWSECRETVAAARFPTAMEIAARIPGRKQRVRLMRLGAGGGELSRHADITDPEAGVADGRVARLHIPLATHPGCVFRSWRLDGAEERLHMPARGLSYIDTRKPHSVINPSDVERIHLVIDTFSSPELRALI